LPRRSFRDASGVDPQLERVRPGCRAWIDLTRCDPITRFLDAIPFARARVLAKLARSRRQRHVLFGDSHSAWAMNYTTAQARVAVGIRRASITSPSDAQYFASRRVDFAALIRARNPHIKWTDQTNRGFILRR